MSDAAGRAQARRAGDHRHRRGGKDVDLLAVELDIHEEAHADEVARAWLAGAYAGWGPPARSPRWLSSILVGRHGSHSSNPRRSRRHMKPSARFIRGRLALSIGATVPAQAGEGHDHGDGPAAPSANGPQRPARWQRLPAQARAAPLGVRPGVTEAGELPRSFELNGKVVMDPERRRQGFSPECRRIEPGPRGCQNPPDRAQGRGAWLCRAVRRADRALEPGRNWPSCAPARRWPTSASLA